MMACSCGSTFENGDTFCGNCGSPRDLTAPPPAVLRPFGDRNSDRPLTVSRPIVSQTGIPDEQAHGNGGWLPGQHHEGGVPVTQSLESADPSPFDADAVYLQTTLRHEPMELALDDSVSLRTIGILLVRAYLAWAISFVVLGILGGFVAVRGGGGTLLLVAFFVSVVVFWVVLLGSKVTEPIGEWRTLLADRAGQSESYYRKITAVLRRRDLPITPQLRSIELNTQGRPVKHTIVLSENEYQAYVTVFPYGTSLYVGWQMWRWRSGARLIDRALTDRMTAANRVTAMLRTDRARAMREAVHLACREAVYATADEGLRAQAQQLRLPQVEQESALLTPQPASPLLQPPSTRIPASSFAPPLSGAPMERPHE
jgi:hypothetical protein